MQYLGHALPSAVFAMLVVYCMKNVSLVSGTHGVPELIATLVTVGLHLWKRQMLISIAGGTACYMLMRHLVFRREACGPPAENAGGTFSGEKRPALSAAKPAP